MSTLAWMDALHPQELLQQHFGFSEFREGQQVVIEHLLNGKSAAAVFPTGGGKSLCYQLPALALDGLTLVVSPLIALMKDQIDALTARRIAAARLDSTLSADESRQVMESIRRGDLKLLYVAPERFNNEMFRQQMQQVKVSLFAVDEAHCISEWGHNFRPDYLKLAEFAKQFRAERILALTATATPAVLKDMCRVFHIAEECAVCTGFYRSNLQLVTTPVDDTNRNAVLIERLKAATPGPTIVYVTLQKTAMNVAARLQEAGFDARPYHAGLKDDVRSEVQDWFLQSDSGIVVATIAFGMGVDKSNIRAVYHYNLPKSLENYSQEIGRAGRDGLPSVCETLACPDDLTVLENFVLGDTPTAAAVGRLLAEVFGQEEEFDISLYELAQLSDIRPLVVRTLLTYLELDGYLEGGTPFYSGYQFKPLMSSAEILKRFEGERQQFLKKLLAQSVKRRTWFGIDTDQAAARLGEPRDRIIRALDYLGEQQMLELKVEGVRNRYRRLKQPDDLQQLTQDLYGRMADRERRELQRLDEVLELIELDACQTAHLCRHFGKPLEDPCGHCSWCQEQTAAHMQHRSDVTLSKDQSDSVRKAIRDLSSALPAPEQIARILCGLSTPAISAARLQKSPHFARFEEFPYRTILVAVRENSDLR
ncbi:MAG: ATP-dependent DNA helicase RecQ [Planctomycetaceae bacterium]